jgi:hypothetical protein
LVRIERLINLPTALAGTMVSAAGLLVTVLTEFVITTI